MSRLWLSETDMEVACFHPVCGRALQEGKHPIKYTLYFHKIENSISTLVKS